MTTVNHFTTRTTIPVILEVNPMKLLLSLGVLAVLAAASLAAEIHHAQGEMAGEVTQRSVVLQSRLTAIPGPDLDAEGDIPGAAGMARFEWSTSPDFTTSERSSWIEAVPEHDFIVRTGLEGLQPGHRHYYRLIYGQTPENAQIGPVRSFKTLPANDAIGALTFCMGSCQNYAFFMYGKNGQGGTASAEDRRLGYPSYAAMRDLEPDFFIGTGDIVYYDHPANTAARTLPELRRKWHEQFRFPRMMEFFARTPAYWSKDDHDFRFNDADLQGQKLPAPQTGIEIFREQMPMFAEHNTERPSYRTHRVHPHLQLWFTEGRDFRSPNRMPDGPEKSLWGDTQREWLKQTLLESDATWKIIVTPTPMVGPDNASKRDNHANLAGFQHEAREFFQWLQDHNLRNVLTFCGDRHWQYHSIHPQGVEEFSCGALNDENAISGIRPGDKNSSDPEGRIRQPFLYPRPSGGFLHVRVGPNAEGQIRMTIGFRDDEGTVLHEVVKSPNSPE